MISVGSACAVALLAFLRNIEYTYIRPQLMRSLQMQMEYQFFVLIVDLGILRICHDTGLLGHVVVGFFRSRWIFI